MDLDKFFEETNFAEVEERVAATLDEKQKQEMLELPTEDDCVGCKI